MGSSGFDFSVASAFGVYFHFALELDFVFALEAELSSAFRMDLGADAAVNIVSNYFLDMSSWPFTFLNFARIMNSSNLKFI